MTKKQWVIFSILGLAILIVAGLGSDSRAGLAKFYPDSCLGGWQNSQAASGEPDGNSATLSESLSEIFCGNFQGEIPNDTTPKKFSVKFAWLIDEGLSQASVATTTINTANFESKAVEILDSSTLNPVELTVSDATSTVSTSTDSVVPVEVVGDDQATSTEIVPKSEEIEPEIISTDSIGEDGEKGTVEEEITPLNQPVETTPEISNISEPTESVPESASIPEVAPSSSAETSWLRYFIDYAIATTTTAEEILAAAPSEKIISPDDWLEVFYTLDGDSWQGLGRISRSNWRDATLELPIINWSDLSRLQISVRSLPRIDRPIHVSLDSVWLEVDYGNELDEDLTPEEIAQLPRVELPASEVFLSSKKEFRASETPDFILANDFLNDVATMTSTSTTATSTVATSTKPLELQSLFSFNKVYAANNRARILKTSLYDSREQLVDTAPEIEVGTETINLNLDKLSRSFRPGKYRLMVEILQGRQVIVSTIEFYWGVLAINANKSVYSPNENAYLQMAVLNDYGNTICNANLKLEITGPAGSGYFLTTDGTIISNETCGDNNVTDEPDYFINYQLGSDGVYQLTLTNLGNGQTITDAVTVRGGDNFQIERSGATRINPFMSDYVMKFKIKAEQVFSGFFTEVVPNNFEITDSSGGNVSTGEDQKTISWPLSLTPGGVEELLYRYQAPEISPLIHLLGPASLEDSGANVFAEERQWQLAADAGFTSFQTGNWNLGSTWTNGGCSSSCVEGTDYPGASDTATISAGHTVTITADHSASNITINSTGTLTTDNNSRNLTLTGTSGTLLTRSGTFTAGNSTTTITSASGSPTLSSSGTTFNNLTINSAANVINAGVNMTVNGNFYIQSGVINITRTMTGPGSGSGTFTIASGATLCLGGASTGTTSTCNDGTSSVFGSNMPTFQTYDFHASSNVVWLSNSAQTISDVPQYGNLSFTPVLTTNRTYTFSGAASTTSLTIVPTATAGATFNTVLGSGGLTVSATTTASTTSATSAGISTSGNPFWTGNLDIGAGGSASIDSIMTLTGPAGSTLLTKHGNGSFGSTGTTTVVADANVTLTSGAIDFGNLEFSPTLTADRTYTFGSSAVTVSGNFHLNPTAGSARVLTAKLGGSLTVAASGRTLVSGSGSGTSVLDTTTSNYALSSGLVNIFSAGTFTANGSTITLSGGSSGPLFSNSGVFNANTSTVVMSPDNNVTLTGGSLVGSNAFHILKLTPTLDVSDRTYTFGGAASTTGSFEINPVSAATKSLTVNLGGWLDVGSNATTTIKRTTNTTSVLNTTGSNYPFNSGQIDIETGGTLTANASTVTLTGDSDPSAAVLLVNGGTLNVDSSLFVFNTDADANLVFGNVLFYDLQITPTITADRLYYLGTDGTDSFVQVANNMTINPTSTGSNTLTVKLGAEGYFDGNSVIDASGSASLTFDTNSVSSYVFSASGTWDINSGATFLGNGSDLTFAGTLTLSGGTFSAPNASQISASSNLTISSGSFTSTSGNLLLAGNFSNSGTFNASSGTVWFNGTNQTISGATTFYSLKKLDSSNNSTDVTLTFPANVTNTVTGRLTFTGTDSNDRVKLVSSSPGTKARLTVSGTFSLNYVFPADNDASLGERLDVLNGTDGGGNLNWNFDGLPLVIDANTETFPNVTPDFGVVATSSILTVKTANHNGFVITAYRSNGTATMVHNSFPSFSVVDKTAWVPNAATTSAGNATASTTEPQTLQFRVKKVGTDTPNYASAWWGSDDTTTNALFAGLPSSAQNIVKRSTAASATTTIIVLYNVAVSATLASGPYSGDVVYEATLSP